MNTGDKPISAIPAILQGQLEERINMLTATCLLYTDKIPESVFKQLEALHKISKDMRSELNEQTRLRQIENMTETL